MIILWGNCLGTRWKTSGTAGWKPQRNQIIEVPSLIGLMSLNYCKVDLWLHFGKSNLEFRRRKEKIQIPWRNYCHNGNPISHLLLYNTSPQKQVTSIAADMYYSHSMSGIWEQLGHRLVSPNGSQDVVRDCSHPKASVGQEDPYLGGWTDSWQDISVPCHVDFSKGLLSSLTTWWLASLGFMTVRHKHNAFYDLASEVTHCYFYNVLWVIKSQLSFLLWKEIIQECEN